MLGGTDTSRCTWSAETCPLRIYTSNVVQICRTNSRNRRAISPRKTGLRYFVTQPRWYFRS